MKASLLRKFNAFPYPTSQRKTLQSWNPLLKLSFKRKKIFKNQKTFFSLEYGRVLSKKVLWQVALNQGRSTASSWALFRSLLFHKLWMFNNPSLVPGVVWPVKSKKNLITKLKAFKVLADFTGQPGKKFLKTTLQKLKHLSSPVFPTAWSMVSGLDSLKSMVLLKSGMVPTHASSFPILTLPQSQLNGKFGQGKKEKKNTFIYPGDFWVFSKPPYGEKPTFLWSLLFSTGPCYSSATFKQKPVAKASTSMYQQKPFVWMGKVYQKGVFMEKKSFQKRNFVKTFTKFFGKNKNLSKFRKI